MPELPHKSPIVVSARSDADRVHCVLAGEIDLKGSGELRQDVLNMLQSTGTKKLLVNLAKVQYMDSSGVAVFVEAMQKLRKIGGKIILSDLQPRVKGLLEIAKLTTMFTVVSTEAEGLKI